MASPMCHQRQVFQRNLEERPWTDHTCHHPMTRASVSMHVRMDMHMYVSVNVTLQVSLSTRVGMSVCVYVCVCVSSCQIARLCKKACMHECVHVCTCLCTCVSDTSCQIARLYKHTLYMNVYPCDSPQLCILHTLVIFHTSCPRYLHTCARIIAHVVS